MGVSARIVVMFLLISAATAVPTTGSRQAVQKNVEMSDLNAESSEIISEAVAPPSDLFEPDTAATDHTDHSIEYVGDSQNFFPSFANLFSTEPRQNNFRLGGYNSQEGAYSQRPNSYRSLLNYPLFGAYRNLDNFGKPTTQAAPIVEANPALLGSGNFGIIRGGTFLAQNDEDSNEYDSYNSYYNNGHGRPSFDLGYIANPRPNYNQDQFANFRDFADINTPANSAYSHFVVVYANKNSTMDEISEETRNVVAEQAKPKNIFETLEQLDKTTAAPVPKLSKTKAKLERTKQKINKKEQWKKSSTKSHKVDPEEPLLALS